MPIHMTFVRSCLQPLKSELINTGGNGEAWKSQGEGSVERAFPDGELHVQGTISGPAAAIDTLPPTRTCV